MTISRLIEPEAPDGLSKVQRAILRYLKTHNGFVRCSNLNEDLLHASACPGDVTEEMIDAAVLTMSHPSLSRTPALDYAGAYQSPEGWLPGPVYRMVALGHVGRDLLDDSTVRLSLWDDQPVALCTPYALRYGCCSWEVEVDSGYGHKIEQAARRIRCRAIHCLAQPEGRVIRAIDHLLTTDDLPAALALLDESGSIPQGIGLGRCTDPEVRHPADYVLCLPSVSCLGSPEESGGLMWLLRQPACGRHFGEDIRLFGGEPIRIDVDSLARMIGREHDRLHLVAPVRLDAQGVLIETSGILNMSLLVNRVPVVPLPKEVIRRMLTR